MTEEWEEMARDVEAEIHRTHKPKSNWEKLKETASGAAHTAKQKAGDVQQFAKYDSRLDPLKSAVGGTARMVKQRARASLAEIAEKQRERAAEKAEIRKLKSQQEATLSTQWKYHKREMQLAANLEKEKTRYAAMEGQLRTKLRQKPGGQFGGIGMTPVTFQSAKPVSFQTIRMASGKSKSKAGIGAFKGISLSPMFKKKKDKSGRRRTIWD